MSELNNEGFFVALRAERLATKLSQSQALLVKHEIEYSTVQSLLVGNNPALLDKLEELLTTLSNL